jgi:hypothetical protein
MAPTTKSRLLWSVASLFGVATLGLAVLGFVLVKGGAYPPEGTGSLGHVGMVIAGALAGFLALILGGLTIVCVSKGKAVENAGQAGVGK